MTTTMERPVTETDPFAHIEYVDPRPGKHGEDTEREGCGKCMGTGSVSWGVDVDGVVTTTREGRVVARTIVPKVCFDCRGVGFIVRKVKNIRAQERRRVKAYNETMDRQREYIANAAVREAEEAARLEAFRTATPSLARALDVLGADNSFAQSLIETVKANGALTERQEVALQQAADRETARQAQDWIGTEGEVVEFEAKVEEYKVFDGYAYGTSSYMFILRTTGGDKVTVFSSAQFMFDLCESGEVARFTATVKAHKDYQGAKETQVARIKRSK